MQKELHKHQSWQTWDFSPEPSATLPLDAVVYDVMDLHSVKNAEEIDPELQELKSRIVGRGDAPRMPSMDGERIGITGDFWAALSGLPGAKIIFAHAEITGNKVRQFDLEAFYIQKRLKDLKSYVRLSRRVVEAMTPDQRARHYSMKDPVYRLRKALYGLKRAGFDAITTLRHYLRCLGWEPLDADPAVYSRKYVPTRYKTTQPDEAQADREELALIATFSDDGAISADEDEADLIVAEIEREYALKVQGEAEKFVGLKIRGRRMDPDGTKHVYFGHPDHCEFIATQYEGMIGKLKPSNVPARDDLYHDIHLKERKQPENIKAVQKMIGCALWRGRVDRPDTMNAIAMLASRISTWDGSCDDALACLVGFLRSSKDMCLHFKVAPGEKWANVRLTAYADASLRVPRSITGIVGVVTSTAGTWCPFLSVSRKQPLSTHSAPAAECVALVEAVQLVLPWAPLFSENPVDMCSDSMAAVLGAERGGHIASVAYLYAGKAIQLRFCVIGDLVAQQVITVRHVDGHTNAANQLTKVLGRTLYEVERAFLVELFRCGE